MVVLGRGRGRGSATAGARALLSVSLVGGSNILGQVATAGLYVVVARASDPRSFGQSMAALAGVYLLADFLDLGHNTRHLRDLAIERDLRSWYQSSLLPRITIAAFGALAWAVLLPLIGFVSAAPLGGVLIGHLAVQAVLVILRVGQHQWVLAWTQAGERVVALAAAVALLTLHVDPIIALAIALITGEAFVVISVLCALRPVPPYLWSGPKFSKDLISSWRFCMMTMLTDAAQINVLLVTVAAGATTGGVFSVAARMASAMSAFTFSAMSFLLPSLVEQRHVGYSEELRRRIGALLAIVLATVVLLSLVAPHVVESLFGRGYTDAVVPFVILTWGAIPSALSQIAGAVLIAEGREGELLRVHIVFAALLLPLIWCGAVFYESAGAASASFANAGLASVVIVTLASAQRRRTRNSLS